MAPVCPVLDRIAEMTGPASRSCWVGYVEHLCIIAEHGAVGAALTMRGVQAARLLTDIRNLV